MRISDWSSDVCSSDLAAHRIIDLPVHRNVHRAGQVGGLDILAKVAADLGDAGTGQEVRLGRILLVEQRIRPADDAVAVFLEDGMGDVAARRRVEKAAVGVVMKWGIRNRALCGHTFQYSLEYDGRRSKT